ncbi:uncharacterized protein LOC131439148 [Malaya genurostris]|uniref:uncharacterized protein LOC131439148 n=1 Tax=Malaya genurostris TaxID=325434 RepID=UPI0026F3CAFD|nr:uncharacterized protein LOC131439148 [Malaya genurostris]
MDPSSLTEEEIWYELALRHVNNLGVLPRRARSVRLRALMQEDEIKGTIYNSSAHVMDAADNISQCQIRVRELMPEMQSALKRGDLPSVRIILSRLTHYRERLAIVEPPENLKETHATLSLLVQFSLEDIDDVLGNSQKNGEQAVNSDGARKDNTGAIPKDTRRMSTSAEANLRGFDVNGDPINQSVTANLVPQVAQQQSRDMSSLADASATVTPRSNSTRYENETGIKSFQTQRSYRGRGANILGPNPSQNNGYNGHGESSMRDPTFSSMPPPPYVHPRVQEGDARERNHLIRDELIRRLNYQQHENTQGPLLEERRTLKAIHNWPFRYKGEKDGSSLNTFLQRVETFAASEEIGNDILLRNVKHLLMDDALNWYSNLYPTGQLATWEDFKRLIRHEFLPTNYAYILRAEAYHRLQGENESFNKFYQDISILSQYVDPPMSNLEKLFIIKKNMNTTYAPIAASQHSIYSLVQACKELDELKKLQQQQRHFSFPQEALIEPSLGTPGYTKQRQPLQRFGRVHALEAEHMQNQIEYISQSSQGAYGEQPIPEEDKLNQRMDTILQQVNALRLRFDRREASEKPSLNLQSQQTTSENQHNTRKPSIVAPPTRLICWNCDAEGHRFMDCDKPQAILFCYRCGQKGYSLRNCPTCLQRPENLLAGNK